MEINNKFKNKIDNCVVRIIAEDIDINWRLPYLTEEPSLGQGSGFFIDKEGHILTCAHVVNAAKNIYIEIPYIGSDKYQCDIIGICPHFDIALLKTKIYKPDNFLNLGDSSKLEVGREVQVVGYPVSFSSTFNNVNNLKYTVGIISGQQKGLIQTDSAINPGNSGGPLFCNNKVIGINSMKLVGESLENIGYAIPINYYKVIQNNFYEKIVYRPNLLLEYNNTDKDIINELTKGEINKGIIVSRIFEGSILKDSNLVIGSIITEINDIKIDNYGLTYNYKWLGTNINIDILMNTFKNDDIITIKYYNNNKLEKSKYKLIPFVPPIRIKYNIFENIDYFIIGGIILMNFSINHIYNINKTNNINLLYAISKVEELLKPRIIISFIFPNGKVNILNNIRINSFIVKINDIEIKYISEIKNILNNPILINNKEYIKIETDNCKCVLLSIEEIIREDQLFSEIYKYPLNEFHKKYIKKLKIKN
jgi:S1-C subfamily serine protease